MTSTLPITSSDHPLPALARARAYPWFLLWGLLIVCEAVLLANHAALDSLLWRTTRWFTGDQDAYRWNDYKIEYPKKHPGVTAIPFYARIDPPLTRAEPNGYLLARFYKHTEGIWRVFRDLGEPVTTALVIALVWIYDRRRWKAALIVLVAAASTGALSWLIRAAAGRYRPVAILNNQSLDGGSFWVPFRGFSETSDLSWPSGHSTLAFATAAALIYLSPKGKWLFLFIAAGCAITRVVMQAHFYSDILFGSVLGWTVGWFSTLATDRLIPDPLPSKSTSTQT
jgi:membrane-associated phospholipid phosphatase